MSLLENGIAVVGIACRFPGAKSKDEYWNNLVQNKETVKEFTDEELQDFELEFDKLKDNPNFVKRRGVLEDIDQWDANFFNITPTDAKVMDPQHRIWLQNTWHAFEDAGMDPFSYEGRCGVYTGSFFNNYLLNNVLRDPLRYEQYIRGRTPELFQTYINSDPMFLATKTAYHFNLKGPAINIQTACSTSLVAISQACTSLLAYESDACVAGGVCVITPQETGYVYQEGAIGSPDGSCRPFDKNSKGTVFGNGVGTVILKRLKDAVKDGDRIYSVIRGWSVNNDGKQKLGFTAPGVEGQFSAISDAQAFADVRANEIQYIEAHGTATSLGDPIEVTALTKAFRVTTNENQFCGIGSVKSNIGHLDTAAGVASLIKISLAAYYKVIPATLHYTEPSPYIDFENSPFYVLDKNLVWNQQNPLIMGVSSFGVGGTNAHVIVQDYPQAKSSKTGTSNRQLVVLSAKSEQSLKMQINNLVDFVDANPEVSNVDVAYTLLHRRSHMPIRAIAYLGADKRLTKEDFVFGVQSNFAQKVVFLFPGQGAQYLNMGHQLYAKEMEFKKHLNICFSLYKEITGQDIKSILFDSTKIESDKINNTEITQPALFIIEYSLAKLYIHLGISPEYMIGHSIGEYAAACISGVFSLESALRIVIKRGELMQSMRAGRMVSVFTTEENLKSLDAVPFEMAAINSKDACTISIKMENYENVIQELTQVGFKFVELNTSHAFHSADFDPILEEFEKYVGSFEMSSPNIPFISCVTGEMITTANATSASYWAKQLRATVQFNKGIETLTEKGENVYLEVGPNTHLASNLYQNPKVETKSNIISTLAKLDEVHEYQKFIRSVGKLWMLGQAFDDTYFYGDYTPKFVALPNYAFDNKRFWLDFKLSDKVLNQNVTKESEQSDVPETDISISESLITIWEEILGVSNIKPKDDFFSLGGHSLLALQILNRISDKFGINIPLERFLEAPSVDSLEQVISKNKEGESEPQAKIVLQHTEELSKLPLTNTQSRIWISSLLNKSNPSYNIPYTFLINGVVDENMFKRTINVLFKHHHIMHSVFLKDEKHQPYSKIDTKASTEISQIDLSKLNEKDRIEKVDEIIRDDARQAFDLEKGPLYRVVLIKAKEDQFYFYLNIHHLIFDGLSWSVLVEDFNIIYNAIASGQEVSLKPLEYHQYDYAIWESNHKKTFDYTDHIRYWKETLEGIPEKTNIPFDFPRKSTPSGKGEKISFKVSSDLTNKLLTYGKQEGSSLFATVLSAFAVFMNKYTGEMDLCFGCPVSNRPTKALESVFGMFVNTIPLRFKLDEYSTFRELIGTTQEATLQAISHQDLPFEKIVEALQVRRSLSYNPLFQVSFAWQKPESITSLKTDAFNAQRYYMKQGVSPFDITFYMWDIEGKLEGEIEYNCDLFKTETIKLLSENFLHVIEQLCNNVEAPYSSISGFSIATESDEDSVLANVEPNITVHGLFEQNVLENPLKTAVTIGKKSLTYKELNKKANLLAHKLLAENIQGEAVAICMPKDDTLLNTMLAVLKTGAYCILIDPKATNENISEIIKNTNTALVVCNKDLQAKFEGLNSNLLVLKESNFEFGFFNKKVENPIIKLSSNSNAYSNIYSDLVVTHAQLVNFLLSIVHKPGIKEGAKWIPTHTSNINTTFLELMLPVLVGSTAMISDEISSVKENEVLNVYTLQDYAKWSIKDKKKEAFDRAYLFWEEQLSGINPVTSFAYDRARRQDSQNVIKRKAFALSVQLTEKLISRCDHEKTTLYQVLLSAFSLMVNHYSGESDYCIGTAYSKKENKIEENIFGLVTNILPIRYKTEGVKTFKDLVSNTNSGVSKATANQIIPFNTLIEIANAENDSNYNPVFQIAFLWQSFMESDVALLEGKIGNTKSPLDLVFSMAEENGVIKGIIYYNSDLLFDESINRIVSNFEFLIVNLELGFDKPLQSIPYINPIELEKITKFNGERSDYPKNDSIIDLFNEQVKKFPDLLAVKYRETTYTYTQLNEKSNQLAHTIKNYVKENNEPIGLLCAKSSEMVVAILAILKVNGSYVPIDRDYPTERINHILQDAKCNVLLFQNDKVKLDKEDLVSIDINDEKNYSNNTENLDIKISADDVAYIMFTSGTTGQPKGSMIMHKSVNRLVRNTNYISLDYTDRILLTGSVVFDATTFEIWGALLNGGQLYIIDKEVLLSPDKLGKELVTNQITTMWLTSPLFTQLAEIRSEIFRGLKYLLVGGDVLSPSHINKVRNENPRLTVINGYGPTENTTFSTCFKIDKDYNDNIPIGYPISNSTALILDKYFCPVPIGATGELFVGGDGLSKGYLNRPKLNAEKFITDPNNPEQQLFRTGDYVKWLEDGKIEFHGRIDNQLKIRGFRVELGEIESALIDIDHIVEAVIKVYRIKPNDIKLIAFIQVKKGEKFSAENMRLELHQRLPLYMIPDDYVVMDELPKTINGKIDKKGLDFDLNKLLNKSVWNDPEMTPIQQKIYNIWRKTIQNNSIGITDNFFAIGGTSLLVLGVVDDMEKEFGVKVELIHFFENPTIANLENLILKGSMVNVENNKKRFSENKGKPNISGEL